ncbi:MAG TPA: AIM24 family protein, partial [Acidimicrobiales bacterium]|nr:AIM24 family protein [Acidimicrobiales bacterium]
VKLAQGDSIEFSHHVLLWQDESVNLEALPVKGAVNRVRAGIPLVLMRATGPGHIALSDDKPGEIVALPLEAGGYVDAHAGRFLLATGGVSYTAVPSNIFFVTQSGDDTDWHYPVGRYLDHFSAGAGRGLVLLHAAGNTFARTLAEDQDILVHPSALLFKDPRVRMSLHIEWPTYEPGSSTIFKGRYRSIWLRLTGPGRVAVQSVFGRAEDDGNRITRSSGYSSQHW